jgi:Flavin containing amine oxidoreductase
LAVLFTDADGETDRLDRERMCKAARPSREVGLGAREDRRCMARPLLMSTDEERCGIHFAGEHTSLWHGWIQGSLVSGLRAARAITAEIA